jgi:O-6-methylguanine DNA methyltransferase
MSRPERQNRRGPLIVVPIETPHGVFVAHFSERGLAQLDFPSNASSASSRVPSSDMPSMKQWIKLTREAVVAVLAGEENFSLPPLDLRAGTDFQQRVWSALQRIGLGETRSYCEIAVAIGSPKATRAVGNACGANPIPLIIPCHRVLASGGKLGGFSGGLSWKTKLLAMEGTWPVPSRSTRAEHENSSQRSFSFAHH